MKEGGRLEGFIKSLGLESEDVPKVIGAFVCCKYATWGTGIVLGVRYQPLRRLLLARSAFRKAQPWAQRQRLRLLEVWDQARKTPPVVQRHALASGPGYSSASAQQARTVSATRAILSKSARSCRRSGAESDANRRMSFHWREAVRRAGRRLLQYRQLAQRQRQWRQKQMAQLRATYSAVSARWRAGASVKLLRFQKLLQRQRHERQKQWHKLRASPAPNEWYAWVSEKYWKFSDKLEDLAKNSSAGRFCSTHFGVKPQGLALGFAEGTILFKATSPVVLPLQLWLLVSFFKRQRLKTFLAAGAPASCDDSDAIHSELMVE